MILCSFLNAESISLSTIPHDKDVADCYVKGVRKKLRLRPEDGVTDDEFFRKA